MGGRYVRGSHGSEPVISKERRITFSSSLHQGTFSGFGQVRPVAFTAWQVGIRPLWHVQVSLTIKLTLTSGKSHEFLTKFSFLKHNYEAVTSTNTDEGKKQDRNKKKQHSNLGKNQPRAAAFKVQLWPEGRTDETQLCFGKFSESLLTESETV